MCIEVKNFKLSLKIFIGCYKKYALEGMIKKKKRELLEIKNTISESKKYNRHV
jgi:hypothetical protein